jgi:hypothetical protein
MTSSKKVRAKGSWGSTFVKLKKTNFLPFLSKGKHRCILSPLGFSLYNCPYYLVDCAFML